MGTPSYMAPEQARGETKFVGPAADIYSLGVILYECLTGTVPFRDRDMWTVMQSVMHQLPDPPRKRNPKVPRDLDLICLRCLAKQPNDRYPTAAAMADDLSRFLKGEPVSVRPKGRLQRTGDWIRRHPAVAVLLMVFAFAVPTAIGFGVWEKLQANHAQRQLTNRQELNQKKDELTRRLIRYLKDHPSDLTVEPDKLATRFFEANPDISATDEAAVAFRQMIEAKSVGK